MLGDQVLRSLRSESVSLPLFFLGQSIVDAALSGKLAQPSEFRLPYRGCGGGSKPLLHHSVLCKRAPYFTRARCRYWELLCISTSRSCFAGGFVQRLRGADMPSLYGFNIAAYMNSGLVLEAAEAENADVVLGSCLMNISH